VVLVLLAAIAAMSSQEMAAMQEVTQAVQVETAVMQYSTVAAEDQVLTASKPEVKSSKQ
jgi:mannitol/fructose-specific phosphotransferase system IIA component